ncbi:MAG: NTP transferase domain-containing protein, partial [Oscillospiraceae bacterium]|nr:NTP transferase domain-containing protein [Oscillospiraceae bacterium]
FTRNNDPHVRLVHNERFKDGMFSSVHAGAQALPRDIDGFFLLPSDCCAVSPDTLLTLIGEFEKTGKSSVTRPKLNRQRGHPPLIPATFLDGLLSHNGVDGLKGFLRPLPTLEVEINDPGFLLDMDSPEDYADLLTHLGSPGYPDRAQSLALLAELNTPPDIVSHGEDVAEVAIKIAKAMGNLDVVLLESACLLHDICRMEPAHEIAGMKLLLQKGYPKAAVLIRDHMDLPDEPITKITERELLYLADKLCRRGKLVRLEDTLQKILSQIPTDDIEAIHRVKRRIGKAQEILDALETQHGIGYKDIFEVRVR